MRRQFSILMVVIIFMGTRVAAAEDDAIPDAFLATTVGAPSEEPFFDDPGDPTLTRLIETGLDSNFDMETARQRILQAEAIADQMLAPLLPSVSAEAAYNMIPYNNVGSGIEMAAIPGVTDTGSDDTQILHSVSALLKASYLIDITGKNVTARKASLADAAAARADAQTMAYNLVFLITQTYYDVVYAGIQLDLVEGQVRTNRELLELVEARFDMGSATALDVLQQAQQLEASNSQMPLVRALVETSKHQLAVLVGVESAAELPEIGTNAPNVGAEPALGTPTRLLQSRPDLRADAARLEAATQRKKSTKRSLLPTLMLTGQVGYQMNYIEQLDRGETWGLGAMLSVPLWDGGRTIATVRQARATESAAVSALNQKKRSAVAEVESARLMERAQKEHYQAVVRQLEASRVAFSEARERYVVGLSEYLNVLITLGTHQAAQLGEVQAHKNLVLSRVNLMKALGGNWTSRLLENGMGGN